MILTRKTLTPWVLQHMGIAPDTLIIRHAKLASGYTGLGPAGKFNIVAAQKRKAVSDFYRMAGRHETGFNASIWEAIQNGKNPVRIVIIHQGHVYLHCSPDARSTHPDIRPMSSGQRFSDDKGVAWWPFSDFVDWTNGPPGADEDPSPKAPPTTILDLFGKKP